MQLRRTSILILAIMALVIVVFLLAPRPWMGFQPENNTIIGNFYTYNSCKSHVEKAGGGVCGKNCVVYAGNSIANCEPIATIPKP